MTTAGRKAPAWRWLVPLAALDAEVKLAEIYEDLDD